MTFKFIYNVARDAQMPRLDHEFKKKTVEKTTGMQSFTMMKGNIYTGKKITMKIKKRMFCPIVGKR